MSLFNSGLYKTAVKAEEDKQSLAYRLAAMGVRWTPAGLVGPDGNPIEFPKDEPAAEIKLPEPAHEPAVTAAMGPGEPTPSKVVVVRHVSDKGPAAARGPEGEGIMSTLGHRLHDMLMDDKAVHESKNA